MPRLWLINQFANTPDLPGHTRQYELAAGLVQAGWQVEVFASDFNLTQRRYRRLRGLRLWACEQPAGIRWTWLWVSPYRGNDWRRQLNMLSFCAHLLLHLLARGLVARARGRGPSVILVSSLVGSEDENSIKFENSRGEKKRKQHRRRRFGTIAHVSTLLFSFRKNHHLFLLLNAPNNPGPLHARRRHVPFQLVPRGLLHRRRVLRPHRGAADAARPLTERALYRRRRRREDDDEKEDEPRARRRRLRFGRCSASFRRVELRWLEKKEREKEKRTEKKFVFFLIQ